jgi:hypothetical protein
VVKSLLRPQALIEIEAIAAPGEPPTAQADAAQAWAPPRETGGLVYLSSLLPSTTRAQWSRRAT